MIAAAGKCYTFVFTKGNEIWNGFNDLFSADMPFRSAHFVFKRGSPWVNILNAEIMKNYPYIDQVRRRYFEVVSWIFLANNDLFQQNRHFRQPKCPPGEFATPGATDPLSISSLLSRNTHSFPDFWSVSGIFMLATCGLIISMIILIVEMAVSCF